MNLDDIPFIPAGRGGGAAGNPRLVVIHGMVNAGGIKRGAAKACAVYFSNKATQYYAHYASDPGETFCSVHPNQKAPHVGNANWYAGGPSIGIELACYCDDRDNWDSPDGQAEVARAADLTRSLCDEFGITPRWLTIEQLRAGRDGITDHATAGKALGGSDHTDPGPRFPTDRFMALVAGANFPQSEEDDMTPEQSAKLDALVAAMADVQPVIHDTQAHVKSADHGLATIQAGIQHIVDVLGRVEVAARDPKAGIGAIVSALAKKAGIDVPLKG